MFYTELTSCRSPTDRGQQTQLHCSNLKAERVEQQLLHRKQQYLIHFKHIYRIFLNSNQKGMEDDGSDEYSKFISTMRSAKTRISAAKQQNEPTCASCHCFRVWLVIGKVGFRKKEEEGPPELNSEPPKKKKKRKRKRNKEPKGQQRTQTQQRRAKA
jgi:hypothetical protein